MSINSAPVKGKRFPIKPAFRLVMAPRILNLLDMKDSHSGIVLMLSNLVGGMGSTLALVDKLVADTKG